MKGELFPCLCPLRSTDREGVDPYDHGQHKDTLVMQIQNKLSCHVTTEDSSNEYDKIIHLFNCLVVIVSIHIVFNLS